MPTGSFRCHLSFPTQSKARAQVGALCPCMLRFDQARAERKNWTVNAHQARDRVKETPLTDRKIAASLRFGPNTVYGTFVRRLVREVVIPKRPSVGREGPATMPIPSSPFAIIRT